MLQSLVKETRADFVIANGENASDGLGITPEAAEGLFKSGVDVITSGNHIWQRKEIIPLLERDERILRPENYPTGVPGGGVTVISKKALIQPMLIYSMPRLKLNRLPIGVQNVAVEQFTVLVETEDS